MWSMFNLLEMGVISSRHGSVLGSADKEDIFQICRSLWKKAEFAYLTFRGTCIVIYSCNKSQRDAQFLKFI